MNDELQRRLEAADPLTAGNGVNRTPVHLEGLKENAMMSDMKEKPVGPRFAGVAVLTAVALAGTIIGGGLLGPERALAFSANATLATEAHTLGATDVIHGHTHRPGDTPLQPSGMRIVLSDWDATACPPRTEVLRLSATGHQRVPLTRG